MIGERVNSGDGRREAAISATHYQRAIYSETK